MAGRKQHYIPQCLLAGFEASRSGKGSQVFVYRRSASPYLSWIGDVAAQRDFYSSPSSTGTPTLDDVITSYENRLGPMLAAVRARAPGPIEDGAVPAELVVHLCVRSAFLRSYFDSAAQELIAGVGALFADSGRLRDHLGLDGTEPHQSLLDELDTVIDGLEGLPPDPGARALIKRLSVFLAREGFEELFQAQFAGFGNTIASTLRDRLPDVIRQGHGRILWDSPLPVERLEPLSRLRWWKIGTDDNLVLPDCVAISRSEAAGATFEPYLALSSEGLRQVVLPIDRHHLLVGCDDELPPGERLVLDFNRNAVGCSIDFFVSAVRDAATDAMADTLGEIPERSIAEIMRESLHRLSARPQKKVDAPVPSGTEPEGMCSHSYTVSFLGDFDRPTAETVAGVVHEIVQATSDGRPLSFLHQVIFAADYDRALAELDMGYERSGVLRSTAVSYGTGVAMAPLVIRDGEVRSILVMRSWLGRALLDESDALRQSALHTLVCMLDRIRYMSLVNEAFPGFLRSPGDDPWDAFFVKHIDSISSTYFGTRLSSHFKPDAGDDYLVLFRDSLASAIDLIPRRRLAYRVHGNLDEFLRETLDVLSDVLLHAASAIGHFDGLDEDLFSADSGRRLEETLKSLSLFKWIDTYRRDLRRIHDSRGRWTSPRELLMVSIHVERLLWAFGIFPWRTAAGEIRVEIPLDTDIAALKAITAPSH